MVKEFGHSVLRLHPYHCYMNAIEYACAELKNYVRNHNTTDDIGMSNLLKISEEAINNITVQNWRKYRKLVVNLEQQY